MKLKVQVIKNHEDYMLEYQRWEEDPLIYSKPEMDIEYEDMVICDKDIYAYKITKSINRQEEQDIVIYTDAPHFEIISVDYNEEVVNQLDAIMQEHNKMFYINND
jgi:hypothetical protein